MAYTPFKRKPRCFKCRRRNVALYTLHGLTGSCHGVLCAADLSDYMLDSGFTAHPLGNLYPPRRRARHGHPARG